MKADPSYAGQSCMVEIETIEGRLFFLPTPEKVALLKYLLGHYAPKYKIGLNLALMMGDRVALHYFDHEGRGSQFISAVFGPFVRILNGDERSGSMVQPGRSKPVPILDAESELEALVQTALLPTKHITPNARSFPGLLFGPEQVGQKIELTRPEILDRSRVFPPSVKATVAAPKFHAHLGRDALAHKFRRKLKKRQKDRCREKEAAGPGYVGVDAALRRRAGSLPPKDERRPPGRRSRRHFLAKDPDVVEQAMEVLREFREAYQVCLEALRDGVIDIVWPAGTNFHHFINGFPRITTNPAPIPP